MKNSKSLIQTAITGLLAFGVASLATTAYADEDHSGDEQCAGVIKAGKNDCATSMNDCHGHVEKDNNRMAWIYVPKGTCEKISGAHLVSVKEPPKKG